MWQVDSHRDVTCGLFNSLFLFQSKQRKIDKVKEEEDRQKRIAEREKKQEEEARKRRQVRCADDTTGSGVQ